MKKFGDKSEEKGKWKNGKKRIFQPPNLLIFQSSGCFTFYILLNYLVFCFSYVGYAAFSDIGIAARPIGMGGAFTAVADDASAVFWNPAGLVQLGHYEVSSMYLKYADLDNVSSQMFSGVAPLTWNGAVAASLLMTGETGLYMERTLLISYGQDVYEYIGLPLAVGVSLKNLSISYEGFDQNDPLFVKFDDTVTGWTGALGLIYQVNPDLKFAGVIDNLFSPNLALNQGDEGNTVNRAFRVGAAYTYRGKAATTPGATGTQTEAIFTAEFAQEKFSESISVNQLRLGVELWLKGLNFADSAVAFRAGTNLLNDRNTRNFTGGLGYRFVMGQAVGLQFDYAFSYFDSSGLGTYHRVSLSLAY